MIHNFVLRIFFDYVPFVFIVVLITRMTFKSKLIVTLFSKLKESFIRVFYLKCIFQSDITNIFKKEGGVHKRISFSYEHTSCKQLS